MLYDGETIDDLQYEGLKIIQKKNSFRYGTDAILLAKFTMRVLFKEKKAVLTDGKHILADFGTGTGIVPIILSGKCNLKMMYGFEVQTDMAQMAQRSVELNELNNKIEIINEDINFLSDKWGNSTIDVVVTNPPYKKIGTGIKCKNDNMSLSRHEIKCTLDDVIKKASELLVPGGHFTMINRPERLADMIESMRKYKLEPKRIQFVLPKKDKAPTMFLVHAVLHGGKNLIVEEPLYLYDGENISKNLEEIYLL